jgi:spore maturation protein SpmB
MSPPGASPVRVDRVVAVAATLRDRREQTGSGYLVSGRLVLTAEHCTRDKSTGEPAARLRVARASDGAVADVVGVVPDRGLDVAVLKLADDAPWDPGLPPTAFAQVDQSQGGVLHDCTGIGFPLFQRDPDRRTRHTSEFHGKVYQTDERESGRLLMREPLIHPGPVADPGAERRNGPDGQGPSPWGGMSGALMFYRGSAIGVVVEHHPRQGDSALRAIGFGRIAADSAAIRQCLGIPGPDSLPCVSEQTSVLLTRAGWPLAEVCDPFALEVHRPVEPDVPQPGLPVLPVYVPRDHDAALAEVVAAAAAGTSGIAVLVGGSSTGKTRACWQALEPLRRQEAEWRLWHPVDPQAALAGLPGVGPWTVVWLNEAQRCLDTSDGTGERVAAGLRTLRGDRARGPVLVLATLWPGFWDELTARPPGSADPHPQARELLAGHDIPVPDKFSGKQLPELEGAGDPRLAQAAAGGRDGQVIQYLAGAPELLARYHNAPPAARALIDAAMDARRLGMGAVLPRAFLEAAAPGYLTDTDWDLLDDGWLEEALRYTAKPAKGVRGPLTPIRSRSAAPGAADSAGGGPSWRLADYLDQHGGRVRRELIPPGAFWAAAGSYADPADLTTLARGAENRGLLRDAARLYKPASSHGSPEAGASLVRLLHTLHPADQRPAEWAAAHASLDDPDAVAELLGELQWTGAGGVGRRPPPWQRNRSVRTEATSQVAALGGRAAAHVSLDDPDAVSRLLRALREAGATDQFTVLLDRDPPAHVSLDDPGGVALLLDVLHEAGATAQFTTLAERAAAHVSLDDLYTATLLLDVLHKAGATAQFTTLAERAAADVSLDDLYKVATLLLDVLHKAGATAQFTTLAERAAVGASLDDPFDVAALLDVLREAKATGQVTTLMDRDPAAHARLDNLVGLVRLLGALREVGAISQVATLASRAGAHVSLDNPGAVAGLLGALREVGAISQVATLASRAGAHVSLDNPGAVAGLLGALRGAGATDQVTTLLDRDPAAHVSLDSPYGVAGLLNALHGAGATDQITTLLDRDPAAHVSLDSPYGVAGLLEALGEVVSISGVGTLLDRDPAAHVSLDDPYGVAGLLNALRETGATNQASTLASRAAAHVSLDNPGAAVRLLDALQMAGAQTQAEELIERLPAAGLFHLFGEQEGRGEQFRFGRRPDGRPAGRWDWPDLG